MSTSNNIGRVRLGKNHRILVAALCLMIAYQTAVKEMIRFATLIDPNLELGILYEICNACQYLERPRNYKVLVCSQAMKVQHE